MNIHYQKWLFCCMRFPKNPKENWVLRVLGLENPNPSPSQAWCVGMNNTLKSHYVTQLGKLFEIYITIFYYCYLTFTLSPMLELCKPVWNIIFMMTFMSSHDVYHVWTIWIFCTCWSYTHFYMCDTWNDVSILYIYTHCQYFLYLMPVFPIYEAISCRSYFLIHGVIISVPLIIIKY